MVTAVSSEQCTELQRIELEALESILGPDFTVLQQKAWHGANAAHAHTCEIILRPEDDGQKAHVAVVMHIILTKTYPNTAPSIFIKTADKRTKGVSRTDLGKLNDELVHRAKTLIGAEMIWELVSYAQEFISIHNQVPMEASKLSLEEEMRVREDEARLAAEKADRADAERRHEEQLERSKALASRIQLETSRQEKTMRAERQRRREEAAAVPPPPEKRIIAALDAAALAIEHIPLRKPISWHGQQVEQVMRGPPLGNDALSRTFVSLSDVPAAAWTLELIPISTPYYQTVVGKRKMEELDGDISKLCDISAPGVAQLLGWARLDVEAANAHAHVFCLVHAHAGAMRMSQLLRQSDRLPWSSVSRHLATLLDALDALHKQGVAHRNVSLECVLIIGEQTLLGGTVYCRRLLDLDRSNRINSMEMQHIPIPNGWIAPEALSEPLVYPPSRDVWDLGRTACQMVYGADVVRRFATPQLLFQTIQAASPDDAALTLARFFEPSRPVASALRGSLKSDGDAYIPPATPAVHTVHLSGDFEEVEFLGKGAFGSVVKARNKLDGRFYAIKKVRLSNSAVEEERTMREIMTLSRLDHPHIVRYVTCWIEETHAPPPPESVTDTLTTSQQLDSSAVQFSRGISFDLEDFLSKDSSMHDSFVQFGDDSDEESEESRSASPQRSNDAESSSEESVDFTDEPMSLLQSSNTNNNPIPTRVLYIQMEYVENQTLGDAIEQGISIDECWRIFRQMLEALAHIASLGIIHRDLKPSNVLVCKHGDIKIGDFGLATTNIQAVDTGMRDSMSSDLGDQSELTGGLGTYFYIAPEVLQEGRVTKYNHKVDMFSLGIIMFEMLASQRYYKTGMERYIQLKELRSPEIRFPAEWDATKLSAQTTIIRQLLDHNPSKRPSPLEMLESPLLPPKMQDEYVQELLRLTSDPASVHRHKLIHSLFSNAKVDDVRDFTFDTGAQSEDDDVLIGVVSQHLRSVFRKRGAVPMHPPLLLPLNEVNSEARAVRLLDASGNVVLLPPDLTTAFARICARSGHLRMKRFDIADVYRENIISGAQPRAVLAASYDIISPEPDPAAEAEVIVVVDEILEIPGLAGETYEIQLGHATILNVILSRFSDRFHSAICAAAPSLHNPATSARARQQLRRAGIGLAQIDEMVALTAPGEFEEVSRRISASLASECASVCTAIEQLERVVDLARIFGVQRPLVFAPLLTYSRDMYAGGPMFAVVHHYGKHRDVIAAGGRYDNLIRRFAFPNSEVHAHAVGVQISVGKVVSALAKYQQVHVPRFLSRAEDERTFGPWTPRRCVCYVSASAPGLLEVRMQLCTQLWTHGISADIQYENSVGESPEITAAMCRAEGISFLIFVRARSPILKVKEVTTRTEYEITRDDIVQFLNERIARQRRIDHTTGLNPHTESFCVPLDAPASAHVPAARSLTSLDVQVVLPERYDRRREKPRDGKIKSATRNLLAERAAQEAVRLSEKISAGQIPVYAVDLSPAVFARFGAAVTASDDVFKALLDIPLSVDERDYVKSLRAQIKNTLESSASSRVMLYAVREGRSIIVG
ncbi:non-specific serine/threonine protein kinase [Malassezia cuniculi]|uniref:non-specific serine/threonine protein kinase n=1 Tax=Malassezia cuniculi TaxID=948313 RepID=A0AAF0J4K6_9BASI|nr:non-specific serine/threonine protein kinase [Malassezia cuniculi]